MSFDPQPFEGLDPQTVMLSLDLVGLEADGRLLQLNSYENRVWQAHLTDGRVVVVKFYRPGRWTDAQILEEHAYAHTLAEADLPVVAPLGLSNPTCTEDLTLLGGMRSLARLELRGSEAPPRTFRYAATLRRVGRAPDLDRPDTLRWMGRMIGRMHAVGQRAPFIERRPLNSVTLGHAPRSRLLSSGVVALETEGAWLAASAQALEAVDASFARLPHGRSIRLHGDCHPGNVLWRDESACRGPNIVDLDDCGMGPAVQDLWMLLPGDRSSALVALEALLEGYRCFMDFDPRELALIEPLRTLRMIHHSAWIAERWNDPAFPVAFPWFGDSQYWAQQAQELRDQIEAMREAWH